MTGKTRVEEVKLEILGGREKGRVMVAENKAE